MNASTIAAGLCLMATAAGAQGDDARAAVERAREPDRRRSELASRMRDLEASLTAGVVDGVYRGRIAKRMFKWDSGDGLAVLDVDVDDDGVAFKGTVMEFEITWGPEGSESPHHHRISYRRSPGSEVQSWRGIQAVRSVRYVAPGLAPGLSRSWSRCRTCVALETRRKVLMISFSSPSAMKSFSSALESFLELLTGHG